ncbi:MAG: PDDEXK nuclease domain-containing protein [Candidatus Accumulibacter phosphatis]|nr:PDDEXK nuclease domain-containing protein [Candidatus Accumulibacter phosphatis]
METQHAVRVESAEGSPEARSRELRDLPVSATEADWQPGRLHVNYYNREIAEPGDQPAIGSILCADKNEALVRYVLDEKAKQIFASRYQFQLPSEDVLRAEIKREMEELDSGSAQS